MKKVLIPLVIGTLFTLLFLGYAVFIVVFAHEAMSVLFLPAALYIVFAFGMGKVTFERIKEIRKGEEDDLSQY